MAEVLGAMRELRHTHRQARIPAPSVGSIMEGLREPIPPEDSLALAASTEGAAEASTAAEAGMAAGATDSLQR